MIWARWTSPVCAVALALACRAEPVSGGCVQQHNYYRSMEYGGGCLAGIDKDIAELPMGMHTLISEGEEVSAVVRMIVCSLLNKPSIVFFDEATSTLDNMRRLKMLLDILLKSSSVVIK